MVTKRPKKSGPPIVKQRDPAYTETIELTNESKTGVMREVVVVLYDAISSSTLPKDMTPSLVAGKSVKLDLTTFNEKIRATSFQFAWTFNGVQLKGESNSDKTWLFSTEVEGVHH